MNRKVLGLVAGGIALGALAVPAAAQVSKPIGLSIRAGVGFPTSSNAGGTVFAAGVEFNLYSLSPQAAGIGSAGHFTISGDYLGKNNGYVIPVLLNFVGTTASNFYYTIGAGLADTHGGSHNSWNFGYRGGIGWNFAHSQTPLFIEADYFGNSNSNFNAIGVYLGVRL